LLALLRAFDALWPSALLRRLALWRPELLRRLDELALRPLELRPLEELARVLREPDALALRLLPLLRVLPPLLRVLPPLPLLPALPLLDPSAF